MDVKFDNLPEAERPIVYVRPVKAADLPAEVRAQLGGVDVVYSVNRPDGERLALVVNRDLAFVLARQHDLAPVSVH